MSRVRAATIADVERVATVLTAAFMNDPVMVWALPEPKRQVLLHAIWNFFGRAAYIPHDVSSVLDGDSNSADAAALWLPPGVSLDDGFWDANGAALFEQVGDDAERLGQLSKAMEPHHPTDDHWYLFSVGVHPARHGSGLGSQILRHTLSVIDERKESAYLEATSRRSRLLYERFGFEVVSEFSPPGGPTLWGMWRTP